MCDGTRAALKMLQTTLNKEFLVLKTLFNTKRDAVHRCNCFHRIITACRLAGKHDGICAVKDRIADIGDLCAGRARVIRHRLEHLCRNDNRLACCIALADNLLLNNGNVLRRDFDAEIAACDHNAVRNL